LCANSLNSVFVRPKCCFSSRFIAQSCLVSQAKLESTVVTECCAVLP
jgi:hypothetical protein